MAKLCIEGDKTEPQMRTLFDYARDQGVTDIVGEFRISYHSGGVFQLRLSVNRCFYPIDGTFQSRLVNSPTVSNTP
jgi:hypothetical protein